MANTIEKSIEQLYEARSMKDSLHPDFNKNDVEEVNENVNGSQQVESADNSDDTDDNLSGEFVSLDTPIGQVNTRVSIASNKMGQILHDQGKLSDNEVAKIIEYQDKTGLNFGGAALKLKLVDKSDILHALSKQYGYSYDLAGSGFSKEVVMASSPFGLDAEEFRSIRSQLLNTWLSHDQKTLAVVSPESGVGSSYVAANLAVSFSQLGRSTLLIDANMRSPRQHKIFNFPNHVGLSMLLADRVTMADMSALPYQISGHQHLSVLVCSAVPPNPAELLSKETFKIILRKLERNFDVIILDTPSASYRADVSAIASAAKNSLMVVKGGQSSIDSSKSLISLIKQSGAKVVGAVLNQF